MLFKLHFQTIPGQQVFLVGNHEALGNYDYQQAVPLAYIPGDIWSTEIALPVNETITYHYFIYQNGSLLKDENQCRSVQFTAEDTVVEDSWYDRATFDQIFTSAIFEPVLKRKITYKKLPASFTHEFSIYVPLFDENQSLCLLGNSDYLGAWDTEEALPMIEVRPHVYKLRLNLSKARKRIEYKYGIIDNITGKIILLEEGENRTHYNNRKNTYLIQDALFRRSPDTLWKGAGIAIPIFSLRSENSLGVGEFSDLHALADWASEIGLSLLQILPINDTSSKMNWEDSYPYSAISVFALHPIFLNISALGYALTTEEKELFQVQRGFLNKLDTVDYEGVLAAKNTLLSSIFDRNLKAIKADKAFKNWINSSADWLHDYAAFCLLRDKHGHCDFKQWGEEAAYSEKIVKKYTGARSSTYTEFLKIAFIQYHLHLQLTAAVDYLHTKGLSLKGDIPIGINRNSVEAWVSPALFHMDMQAGAPPDGFSSTGQNWGFPTYNWEKMKEDNYEWWKNRFVKLSSYFDSFRIDHILGFFRIWQIPYHSTQGVLGYFNPALPYSLQALQQAGLELSAERLTQPYMPKSEVSALFEYNLGVLNWLFEEREDSYQLKEAFNMQRKVENHFKNLEANDYHRVIKNKLLDLLANVLFIEDLENPGFYHPRFGLEKISSFKNLSARHQAIVRALQLDYFYNKHESFWYQKGKEKLPVIKDATNMLICGEDLGLVPASVPRLLKELGILTLEIQRMPKKIGSLFLKTEDIPYLSVITPSTHDMATIREAWEADKAITQEYFTHFLGKSGRAPERLTPDLAQDILFSHLNAQSVLSIFQIQDLFAIDSSLWQENPVDERINIPENIPHYWRYRMPISIETLLQKQDFTRVLRNLIQISGR